MASFRTPAGPKGYRAYVIGDVHGRLDLLDLLMERIADDRARRKPAKSILVFLGDLIDRGPDSCGVIARVRGLGEAGETVVCLAGNHEEVLLRLLAGERGVLDSWLSFGGVECLQSYGFDPVSFQTGSERERLERLRRNFPEAHKRFMADMADSLRFGDYLFVHAGIRPGVALAEQRQADLRWIREPFLSDESDHGMIVVHGHTIHPAIVERPNRIGVDTGAYQTGLLTALAIEGAERWLVDTASD